MNSTVRMHSSRMDVNHPLADHMCFTMNQFEHVYVGSLYSEVEVEQV